MQSINNQKIDKEIPLCLTFNVDAYIIEENGNKHLIIALTKDNKKVLELYKKLWSEIKKQIQAITSDECNSLECHSFESIKYTNGFMKIRLVSHDDLPFNKILCFSDLNILCESVFQIKNKYYPQIHINECEYELEY